MKYENVKNFCFNDDELEKKFWKEDGYIIILSITRQINEYANQLKCVVKTINTLEDWKKESFFKINETTYTIDWFGTFRDGQAKEKVTLPQAKKLYEEIRIKYNTLYEVFERSAEIHYAENTRVLIDKYFSYTKY